MYFFTADEHYNHKKIIEYCNRPFKSIDEMNEVIISNFNSVVSKTDVTVHCGDFCWCKNQIEASLIIKRLNGNHIFLKGSHDRWITKSPKYIWHKHINGQFIVACHYAMRTWERSYHGSWQVFGHSHGRLEPIGKQWDVGVDNNNFYPVSFDKLSSIVSKMLTSYEKELCEE